MSFLYGNKLGHSYTPDQEERSVRDMARIHKPTNSSKFADQLIKKYPHYRGMHDRLVMIIDDELRKVGA